MEYLVAVFLVVFVICFLLHRIKYSRERFSAPRMSMYDYPFETGDLVLTDGFGLFPAFLPSNVDHTAIVYKDPGTGQLFLWHTTFSIPRYANFQPLYRTLEKYKLTFVRKLYGDRKLFPKWDRTQHRELWKKKSVHFDLGIIFQGLVGFLPFLLGSLQEQRRPQQSIFCTALTIQTYIWLGVLSPTMLQLDHLWYTTDFCSWSQKCPLPVLNGFSFGPETQLQCSK